MGKCLAFKAGFKAGSGFVALSFLIRAIRTIADQEATDGVLIELHEWLLVGVDVMDEVDGVDG